MEKYFAENLTATDQLEKGAPTLENTSPWEHI